MKKTFSIPIVIDFYRDAEGDKEKERALRTGSLPVPAGTFWRYSVSHIIDTETNKDLAVQSVVQIERDSLKELIKDIFNRLPRLLDENGLPNK